jgi:nucleotide-binding universal stress UspA family protein
MILIGYDGSDDAKAAIGRAGELLVGKRAVVVCVWEPFLDVMLSSGTLGMGMIPATASTDPEEIDANSRDWAVERADEGAALTNAAGLTATGRAVRGNRGVAAALLACGDELDSAAIVLGFRGRGGMTSLLLGSVSHAVLQHADRAVLVVPSPAVAERRHGWGAGGVAT